MIANIVLFIILLQTLSMAMAKRVSALSFGFRWQSLFLALFTAILAWHEKSLELWIVTGLLLLIKVWLIPFLLKRTCVRIKVEEDLGLLVNPILSLGLIVLFGWLAYLFVGKVMVVHDRQLGVSLSVALTVLLAGFFIMASRMKALAQIIGLLVMENGLFLAASAIAGGMPFFVEIAIFFDVFVCVLILEVFVYKINRLFTHIDVDKLDQLRG
jgi:hydrogenase-4 component E